MMEPIGPWNPRKNFKLAPRHLGFYYTVWLDIKTNAFISKTEVKLGNHLIMAYQYVETHKLQFHLGDYQNKITCTILMKSY